MQIRLYDYSNPDAADDVGRVTTTYAIFGELPRAHGHAMTDRDRLRLLGRCMYGEIGWQVCLARDLGVALRTLQRWASGSMPVPGTVWNDPRLAAAMRHASAELERRCQAMAAYLRTGKWPHLSHASGITGAWPSRDTA